MACNEKSPNMMLICLDDYKELALECRRLEKELMEIHFRIENEKLTQEVENLKNQNLHLRCEKIRLEARVKELEANDEA